MVHPRCTITILAIAHVAAAPPAGGQGVYGGASFTISSLRVWRGLTRVNDLTLNPELYATVACRLPVIRLLALSAGVWGSYAPERADSGDFSDLGPGQFGFGEVDFWLDLTHPLGFLTLGGGMVSYEYHGKTPGVARTPAQNTTELYGHLQAELWRLALSVTTYKDVRRVRGWYIEPSLVASPLQRTMGKGKNPLGDWRVSLDVGGVAGFSLGQEVDPAAPGASAHFAERGLTHVVLSTGVTLLPPSELPVLVQIAWHEQLNRDALVRRIAVAQEASSKGWLTLGARIGGPVIRTRGVR